MEFLDVGVGDGWDHRSQPSSRLFSSTPASALPCPAGRSVPGRGGPERQRRPRPDGTGTPSLLTACSRDWPPPAGMARDSHPWGEAKAHVEEPVRSQMDASERRSNDS
jgi:hypothetical protein